MTRENLFPRPTTRDTNYDSHENVLDSTDFGFCPRLQIKGLGFCESVETFHKCGYTIGMKTAISIPDSIFSAAERFARRLHKSRSQLFTEALAEYLLRHSPDEVTKAMNRTLDDIGEEHNEFVNKASSMILEQNEW